MHKIKDKTKHGPNISGRFTLDVLTFDNHNQGILTSKRNVGGGFQTSTETNIKFVNNYYTLKQENKKIKEFKSINDKIKELKNFNLGLSSNDSASIKHVSSRGSILMPRASDYILPPNNYDYQKEITKDCNINKKMCSLNPSFCKNCSSELCYCIERQDSTDTYDNNPTLKSNYHS